MKLVLLSLIIISLGLEAKVELNKVLESVKNHYPIVLKALQDNQTAKMKALSARGAFDANLSVSADTRTDGFYDGKSFDVKIEKPFAPLNSKVYTGYRKSNGDYPVYEGKFDTLDDGEARLGIELSLLDQVNIDERRAKLKNQQLDIENKEYKVELSRLEAQGLAFEAYWNWVGKSKIFVIKKNLMDLAKKRVSAINKKIDKGALARIYAVENQQYLAQRTTETVIAKQEFDKAAFELSLFYRDQNGKPIIASADSAHDDFKIESELSKEEMLKDLKVAIEKSPKIQSYRPLIAQYENEALLAENSLEPRLDLAFEISKDRGLGSETLEGQEQRFILNLKVPIERNLGKGAVSAAKSEQRALKYQRQLEIETLEAKVRALRVKLNALITSMENIRKEINYASQLESAENQKFNSGGSDFFLVNIREQNTATARVRLAKAQLEYKQTLAEYKSITLKFDY